MRSELAALCLAIALVFGCAPNVSVKPPTALEAGYAQHGASVVFDHPGGFRVDGELLAVEENEAYVLLRGTKDILAVPTHVLGTGKVWNYRPGLGLIFLWGLGGVVSTLSHGFVLILSMPVWSATTWITAATVYATGWTSIPDPKWARYPQGLPESLRAQVVETPQWFQGTSPTTPTRKPPPRNGTSRPEPVL